MNTTVVQCRAT